MTRAAYAVIDLKALRHNYQKARQAAPSSCVMAVIKADAYGHGMLSVAQALEQADAFAVAFVNEAVTLREAGIGCPIVALQGIRNPQELLSAEHHRLDLVLHHPDQLKLLQTSNSKNALRVWLKVDTGMHRLGWSPSELNNAYHAVIRLSAIVGRPALMTHLACADDRADGNTQKQLERFNAATAGLLGECSIANSAAILGFPQTHADWIRPGIMLYGSSPFIGESASSLDLRPVMTLKAPLISIKQYAQGDAIGYGGSFVCPEDIPIGIAAIGYGDGYPRHAPNGTPVLINGQRAPLAGRVSMDMITIDLRGIERPRLGDEVILWGQGLSVDEVAYRAGTISYELLCAVGAVRHEVIEG